jgi:HEPN domain-containing protein
MQPLTVEWVDKAEGDFVTTQREVQARRQPNYDAACFHAQQCAEKYLKARLQEAGIAIPYTHDLVTLLNLLLPMEPTWSTLAPDLRALTVFGVTFRYPGASANRAMARDALARCRRVRQTVRVSLGLPI